MLELLALLVILGIMALGAVGIFAVFYFLFFGTKHREKAEARYQADLPQKFNGANTVAWDISLTDSGTPKKQQLIDDAQKYGYDLDHMAADKVSQTLVFKRQPTTNLADRVAPYLDEK